MSETSTPLLSLTSRWLVVLLLMGFAAIAHFNRIGITVVGAEVLIRPKVIKTDAVATSESEESKAARPAFYHVFSETEMGWIYTAFLVIYTCAMLPGGWLIDRIGSARALTLLGLTMGSFVVLTGVFGWIMSTPQQLWMGLLVIRGLAGICSAPLHPAAAHAIADVTGPVGRSTGNGLITAGAVLGIAVTYPLFGKLMDKLTWQWAFVISGGVMIAYALIWKTLTRGRLPGPNSPAGHLPTNAHPDSPANPWPLLAHRNLWLVSLSYFAYSYYQYLMFYWMSYYFEKVLSVPVEDARQASFIITISQGMGMFVGGICNDLLCRLVGLARGRRGIMVGGMLLCALLTLFAVNQQEFSRVVLFMSLAMGAQGMCESIYWTTATEIGGRSRGFAGAFLNTIGNVGGFISPVLTPKIADSLGWTVAIGVACAICGVGGVMWFLIDTIEPQSETAVT